MEQTLYQQRYSPELHIFRVHVLKWLNFAEYCYLAMSDMIEVNPLKGKDVNWLHFAIQV